MFSFRNPVEIVKCWRRLEMSVKFRALHKLCAQLGAPNIILKYFIVSFESEAHRYTRKSLYC